MQRKAIVGLRHRFRPTYAKANVGHPSIASNAAMTVERMQVESCGIPHLVKNER
jgi:hypothetical protein